MKPRPSFQPQAGPCLINSNHEKPILCNKKKKKIHHLSCRFMNSPMSFNFNKISSFFFSSTIHSSILDVAISPGIFKNYTLIINNFSQTIITSWWKFKLNNVYSIIQHQLHRHLQNNSYETSNKSENLLAMSGI